MRTVRIKHYTNCSECLKMTEIDYHVSTTNDILSTVAFRFQTFF